jgi:hypothetical protein
MLLWLSRLLVALVGVLVSLVGASSVGRAGGGAQADQATSPDEVTAAV